MSRDMPSGIGGSRAGIRGHRKQCAGTMKPSGGHRNFGEPPDAACPPGKEFNQTRQRCSGTTMTESLSSHTTEPVRIARHAMKANQTGWKRWLPGLNNLRQYESSWLRHDLVAGLVMTTMLVPVGIAYAEASGVPGINGLYATIVPLFAYALFGPSRILVLGPDSALAPVILTVVLPLSAGEPQRAVALAGMMAIVSGVVCVAAGLARLGFITELLSKPIRYGYMNGIALTVILSQIPKLFGFSVSADGPVRQMLGIIEKVWDGSTNVIVLAIGGSALVLILVLKRW